MYIKVSPNLSKADYEKNLEEALLIVFKQIRQVLISAGLEFVKAARSKVPNPDWHKTAKDVAEAGRLSGSVFNFQGAGSFNDQTGNLRSSIGYVLMYDGEVVSEDFQVSGNGISPDRGKQEGEEYARQLGKGFKEGWALILVAGMEYASWVEAKGYDVISGSTLTAKESVVRQFSTLK